MILRTGAVAAVLRTGDGLQTDFVVLAAQGNVIFPLRRK